MFSLFDLHCDTPTEAYVRSLSICDEALMASAKKASSFDRYVQIAAIWSDCRLNDEDAYARYLAVRDKFIKEISENKFVHATCANQLRVGVPNYILAVEDARILAGDLSRLEGLYRDGVRFLTLTWAGASIIGGAYDTDAPLTDFGRHVVEECFRLGIIPDLSHASVPVIDEVLTMAEQRSLPVIATHSNAYSVLSHKRNLRDDHFRRIAALGGIVGISFCPAHLSAGECTIKDVVSHIKHDLSLGGENCLAFGADLDGIEKTPEGLSDLSYMPSLYAALRDEGIDEETLNRLFYHNAHGFFARAVR